MVRPAPNVTSVKPSSSNVCMVRPAQSNLASSPAVNVGQRSNPRRLRQIKTVLIYQSLSRYPLRVRVQYCHSRARRYQNRTLIQMTGKISIDFLISTQLLIQRKGHPVPKDRTAIHQHQIAEARKSLRVIIGATNSMITVQHNITPSL